MISIGEIKEKANRWWNDKSFLRSAVGGESFFPKEIPQIGLVTSKQKAEAFLAISEEQQLLHQGSKEVRGQGYSLEWEDKNHQSIGRNRFIKRIYFETEKDYLTFIGRTKDFLNFKNDFSLILTRLPMLKDWAFSNPLDIVQHHEKWSQIIDVCEYFLRSHEFNKFYIRELPVKVHTKFIETNKSFFSGLFDFLLPTEKVLSEFIGVRNFEKRYGLKYDQPLIRIKILDHLISKKYFSGLSDISIPEDDFINLKLPLKNVIIMENKTNYSNVLNFLSLPLLSDTIAIFGSGFRVWLLKDATWLSALKIYYWGDIDTQGLQILSQLRGYHPGVQAVLMDFNSLDSFKEYWGTGTETLVVVPAHLNDEEKKLFMFLKENNIRLEQEKISHDFVVRSFLDKVSR